MTRTELAHKIAETISGKTFSGTAAERQKQLVSAILSLLSDDEVVPHKQTETADTPTPAQIICHGRKFERTGECRMPGAGEWFLSAGSRPTPIQMSEMGYINPDNPRREILREISHKADTLAESPAAPLAPRCPRCGARLRSHILHLPQSQGYCLAGIECINPKCLHLFEIKTCADFAQFFSSPVPTSPELAGRIAALRNAGWSVAVHNDYRVNGEQYTFWLLTNGSRCVKGEGRTDAEALDVIEQELKR